MMQMDWAKGLLRPDAEVRESVKTLGQLSGIFANTKALREMDPTTVVEPGLVDSEYFMTHGHFHLKRDRAEYYGTIEGEGALVLMDETRATWMEPMAAGTVHFIRPRVAHRVANIGKSPLRFVACWPSDAGHDYESIRTYGFGARLLNVRGSAMLVKSDA